MGNAEIDILSTIVQIGGTPALVGVALWVLWKNGPERHLNDALDQISKLGRSIDSLRTTITEHREDAIRKVGQNSDRLLELEVKARECERRKERFDRMAERKRNDS